MEVVHGSYNIGPEEMSELVAAIVEGTVESFAGRRLTRHEREHVREESFALLRRRVSNVRSSVRRALGNRPEAPGRRQKVTPPELARAWGISPEKVLAWIRSGELRAVNAATRVGGRSRFLIDLDDVEAFEQRRAGIARPVKQSAPRRRQTDVTEYF